MKQEKYAALLLENQLCFPLYACSREIIKRYRTDLDALGLTYTQYVVLLVIWQEGTVSVRDLGRRLYLDSGTLTPVLKTLEKLGLITRRRCQEDERVLMVTITEAGLQLRDKALHIPGEILSNTGLDEEETKTLYHLLYKMLAAADQD